MLVNSATSQFPLRATLTWTAVLAVYSVFFIDSEVGLASFVFFSLWILAVANALFGLRRMHTWIAVLALLAAPFVLLESTPIALAFLIIWTLAIGSCMLGLRKVMLWGLVLVICFGPFMTFGSARSTAVVCCVFFVSVSILRRTVDPKILGVLSAIAGALLWPPLFFGDMYHYILPKDMLLGCIAGAALGCCVVVAVELARLIVNAIDKHLPRTERRNASRDNTFQFSFAQALLAMILLCLPLSWIAMKTATGTRNRHLAAWLDTKGLRHYHYRSNWFGTLMHVPPSIYRVSPSDNVALNDDDLAILSQLTSLRDLSLTRHNALSDPEIHRSSAMSDAGIYHLSALTKLRSLALSHTNVTDQGLHHLSRLSHLETLALSHTNVTDQGLYHLRSLESLRYLDLSSTNVSDLHPLNGCRNLEVLIVSRTPITDVGLRHLTQCRNLHEIYLDHTEITDASVTHLRGLTSLRKLSLDSTYITDTSLKYLESSAGLQFLSLRNTHVSQEQVSKLRHRLPESKINWGTSTPLQVHVKHSDGTTDPR